MDEQNISMEELKVDEEESFKDASMEEDILGAQSLLVSDSDEEGDVGESTKPKNKSPLKRVSPKAAKLTNAQNNDIQNEKCQNLAPEPMDTLPDEDENVNAKKVSSIQTTKRILDSDEEDTIKESSKNCENNNNKTKKISKLIDSESDSDDPSSKQKEENNSEYNFKITNKSILSESEDEENPIINKRTKKEKQNSKSKSKLVIQKSTLIDSDSDSSGKSGDEEMDLENAARAANFENNNNNNENSKEKSKQKTKVIRASAKKAMDEMQAIQSEQQRLHREAHISIPYHKPKKHSLQDFLNRKTVLTPKSGNSPVPEPLQRKSLKMTQEELEEYAKLMEERAKEAKEFFKSESEDEDEQVFMDNKGVMDLNEIEQVAKDNPGQETNEEPKEADNQNLSGVCLTEEELAEILVEEYRENDHDNNEQSSPKESVHDTKEKSTPKVLITEVIELPKLDMNTVNISPVKKPKRSLNVKELLKNINVTGSPSISGDPNKLIDLETGDLIERKPSGVENLMQRLMATVKAKKLKNSEKCNILSTENGKIEMTTVNVSLKEDKDPNKDPKPGAAYFELKKNLKEIIKKKRLEELHKKQGDDVDHEEEEEEETVAEEYEPESKPNSKLQENEIDEEENVLDFNDEEELNEEDEPTEIDNDEDDDDDDDENNEESNEEENEDGDEDEKSSAAEDNDLEEESSKNNLRKSRIIKAFDDSDGEDRDPIDFLKPQQSLTSQLFPFETQSSENNAENDENELLGLCSGTFDSTQAQAHALMSQIPVTQNQGKPADDDVLMQMCSGTFDEPLVSNNTNEKENENAFSLQPKGNKIFSTDDEEDPDNHIENKRNKKFTKKQKKNTAKLEFSDDENEDQPKEIVDIQVSDDDEEVLEADEEEPETFIDYDSEENEVVVQMTKKECVKQAEKFLENEAELSESEWGSADEDEKNLDKYDIELGDEDEFDKEKIRSELEQIHARKMLDEDMREVRKIQEMLFEDEEKDGVGRQRQFRWKNAENGFSLEDGANEENGERAEGDSGDEITEHQWRKIRFEREQFLKEQGLKPGSQEASTTLPNSTILHSPKESIINTTVGQKKIQIITKKNISVTSSSSTNYSEKSNPFLISKGITAMHKKSVRGSFLIRDKDTLQKLAGITKGAAGSTSASSDMAEAAGTVSLKGVKAQNFVFATLTEEEHQTLKRKSDDLLNSSNENGVNYMKKPKTEPRRDKCFIDQLL